MTKKITYKKIKTSIPEDAFISNIGGLIGNVRNVILEVRFDSISLVEIDNTMFALIDMSDADGNEIKGLMIGSRDDDFKDLVKSINISSKYRVRGSISLLDKESCEVVLPFRINDDRVFCITALQNYSY